MKHNYERPGRQSLTHPTVPVEGVFLHSLCIFALAWEAYEFERLSFWVRTVPDS